MHSPWCVLGGSDWRALPSASGVYAICLDGKVVYIGQSKDLRERLKAHARRDGSYAATLQGLKGEITVRYSVHRGDTASRMIREARLIARLQPKLNGWGTERMQSEPRLDRAGINYREWTYPILPNRHARAKRDHRILRRKFLPAVYQDMLAGGRA